MKATSYQENVRYYEPQVGRSETNLIVDLIGHAIDIRIKGDRVHSQHIINQLIIKYPARSHSIRLTAANMLTERITNGTQR